MIEYNLETLIANDDIDVPEWIRIHKEAQSEEEREELKWYLLLRVSSQVFKLNTKQGKLRSRVISNSVVSVSAIGISIFLLVYTFAGVEPVVSIGTGVIGSILSILVGSIGGRLLG
jgi:hypothetical protein